MSHNTLLKIKRSPAGMSAYRSVTALGAVPYRIWNNVFSKTIVLLYHRVGTVPVDPHALAVSSKNFEAQLAYLKKNATVISVIDLHNALARGVIPKRTVVITFDDGYEDNYTNAFPLLKKYGLPATIFTTGDADPTQEIWIDQLMQVSDPNTSQYHELFEEFKLLSTAERTRRMEALFSEKKISPAVRPDYRRLAVGQLHEMINSGLITIGGHTVNHCKLSSLDFNEQENEISRNANFISSLSKQALIPFAYPFGSRRDFTADTITIVKRFYSIAFAAYRGRIKKDTNHYSIPRFAVKDENEKQFSKRLKSFWGQI